MSQPKKDALRAQLVLAAREIEFLRAEYHVLLQRTGMRRLFPLRAKFKSRESI